MNRKRRKNGRRAPDRERRRRMNHGVMACATHESTDRLARRRLPRKSGSCVLCQRSKHMWLRRCAAARPSASCFHPLRGNAASMSSPRAPRSRSGRTPSERAASAGLPRPSSGRSSTSIRTPVAKAHALSTAFSNSLMFPRPRIVEDSLQCGTREPGDRLIYSLGNLREQCVRHTSEIVEPLAPGRNVESANV